MIPLDTGGRYKLTLIVKDLNTGNIGVYEGAIVTPRYLAGKLALSSLISAASCVEIDQASAEPGMFVLGDFRVYPNTERLFSQNQTIGLYFQIYNATLDQASQIPSLSVSYRISHGSETRFEILDDSGEFLRIYRGGRVAVVRSFDASSLGSGAYRIDISVQDKISGEEKSIEQAFRIGS